MSARAATLLLLCPVIVSAYPLDGFETTGITRLQHELRVQQGEIPGPRRAIGARLPTGAVDLRLLDAANLVLPDPNPSFTDAVVQLLGDDAERYSIAVLDISDPANPRYAEYRGDTTQNVGSVGKIVVALALFQALADIYPQDINARMKVLRATQVTANEFIQHDSHKVRIADPQAGRSEFRPIRTGDQGNLWEFLDWMMSASSNAAAAMVMQQTMLLVRFGKAYPVANEAADRFFREASRGELARLRARAFEDPVRRNGLDPARLRQGSFFTREGKRRVPGTTSYGSSRELMRFILLLEQGQLVDAFSSREIKRLLYMTEKRIRYASSPALARAAVYFKSGSFYKCEPEQGFTCRKYHGNVRNSMNSIAIVESPAGGNRIMYLVALTSDVLRKNSALAHQALATRLHQLLEKTHPVAVKHDRSNDGKLTSWMLLRETQTTLKRLGYYDGRIDGVLGPKTTGAIKTFQEANNLEVNGLPSQALLDQLRSH